MSGIKSKPFNPLKKIARTEFMGYPNLITSSDLNRQVEGTTWRSNQVEEMVGLQTDFKVVSDSLSGTSYKVTFGYTKMYCRGCEFNPTVSEMTFNFTAGAGQAYWVHLEASSRTSTFSDGDMTIAGAEFEDGTTLAAADQIIYYNERIVSTSSVSGTSDSIGILGKLVYDGEKVTFYPNSVTDSLNVITPMAIIQKEFEDKTNTTINNFVTDVTEVANKAVPSLLSMVDSSINQNTILLNQAPVHVIITCYQDIRNTGNTLTDDSSMYIGGIPACVYFPTTTTVRSYGVAFITPKKDLLMRVRVVGSTQNFEANTEYYVTGYVGGSFGNFSVTDSRFVNAVTSVKTGSVPSLLQSITFKWTVPASLMYSSGYASVNLNIFKSVF